jgi:hypothetical protein
LFLSAASNKILSSLNSCNVNKSAVNYASCVLFRSGAGEQVWYDGYMALLIIWSEPLYLTFMYLWLCHCQQFTFMVFFICFNKLSLFGSCCANCKQLKSDKVMVQ